MIKLHKVLDKLKIEIHADDLLIYGLSWSPQMIGLYGHTMCNGTLRLYSLIARYEDYV